MHRRILARPTFREIATNYELALLEDRFANLAKKPSESSIEMHDNEESLAAMLDHSARREPIIAEILKVTKHESGPVLYFGPSVKDSQMVAFNLRRNGIYAEAISGETDLDSRRSIIEDFKSGKISVLCNCNLLTTGFDYPKIKHVFIARPTISTVLYEQMIGRGLRGPLFGGTDTCVIYNVVDKVTAKSPIPWAKDKVNGDWLDSIKLLDSLTARKKAA